jgi:hypothetical protein
MKYAEGSLVGFKFAAMVVGEVKGCVLGVDEGLALTGAEG